MALDPMSYVAGIGASAGGLEAMLPLVSGLPSTGRVSYVVAQHMAKDGHDALVARLIGREARLPVRMAEHGVRLAPDTIYLIPSGHNGCVEGEQLCLTPPDPRDLSTPSVNALFSSIARSARRRAIGIVLSGTGSDGTAGCREIRSGGGLTLAQDPVDAKFDGMPSAAIAGQVIDRVLPAAGMGAALAELFPGAPVATETPPAADQLAELRRLVTQIREATGIDFSSYKEDTLLRRVEKRKAMLGLDTAADPVAAYQAVIRRDPNEVRVLQRLFLVSLSSFFRDAEAFAALQQALAAEAASRRGGLHAWVPACASGEEAYSIAILCAEIFGATGGCDILASDLNPDALEIARLARYRRPALRELLPAMLERHFDASDNEYTVRAGVRDCVHFEQRDVLASAPTGPLDLVSCRNLLIYLKSELQDRLIADFHRALRPGGLLFIGQAESLSFLGNTLFAPVDTYHRLFRRRS